MTILSPWPYYELSLPWGKLAYRDSHPNRPGPTLLLLHGTGCDSTGWEPFLHAWPQASPCQPRFVAMDFRSHGQSETPAQPFSLHDLADDVKALIDHLRLKDVTIAGHSLGGMVAMPAAKHPSIRGLILCEGWTRLDTLGAFDHTRHMFGMLAESEIQKIKDLSLRYRERISPENWRQFWSTVETFDGSAYLRSFDIPIVEVYGTVGRQPGAQEKLSVSETPNIHWLWLEGVGHYLPHECPAPLARAAAEFCVTAFSP